MEYPNFKKKLTFSEARFEAIARTATDSIIISNESSIILLVNDKTCEIFGYEEADLLGREMRILMPAKHRDSHTKGMKKYIESGVPKLIGHTVEIEGLRKDGSVFPLELSLSSWKEEESYFFLGVIRDISKRKQLLKERDENSKKLIIKQQELELANEELMAMYEELEAGNEELMASQAKLSAANNQLSLKERLLTELNSELEKKVAERTKEQKLAQEEAVLQKDRLHRLFMQAPAAVCILDGPNLVYELVNPGYQQLFPGRQLLGKPILEALPEIADQEVYRTFRKVYETGLTHEEQEILIPLASPIGILEDRYFKYIQQARRNGKGQIDGVLVFAYEVTELVMSRKVVEESERKLQMSSEELAATNEELSSANEEIRSSNEELNLSNQQLVRINADLDNFIYTASHDLKAPIANIEGLLYALVRSVPAGTLEEENAKQIVGMMEGSIERFKKTISILTDITRLQKESIEEATSVSLSDTIDEVILDLQPMVEACDAKIEKHIEECSSIYFSQKNLRSIIYNLLSNAIKYHSPERVPLIRIRCRQTREHSLISVKDNGLGIKSADTSKIFSMFKRLHNHVDGSGIGMFMVKRIIDNAGGRIEVKSKVGEGSTFEVCLKR